LYLSEVNLSLPEVNLVTAGRHVEGRSSYGECASGPCFTDLRDQRTGQQECCRSLLSLDLDDFFHTHITDGVGGNDGDQRNLKWILVRIEGEIRWVADFELLELAGALQVPVPDLYPEKNRAAFRSIIPKPRTFATD
jgi:hypothetical protein